MASTDQSPSAAQQMLKGLPSFFAAIAPRYNHWTGSTTRDLFSSFLRNQTENKLSINSSSRIHDNAAGPGTASEAIILWLESQGTTDFPSFTASDSVPAMVEVLKRLMATNGGNWNKVTAEVADGHALPYADGAFTHSICNFSVFAFDDPIQSLAETYRTLQPNGIAVTSTWKRFAVGNVMRIAQRAVQGPNTKPMPVVGERFMPEGALASVVEQAGWDRPNIRTISTKIVVKDGQEMDGLVEFMTGPMTAMTRASFTEEQKIEWPDAVHNAIEAEKKTYGGLLMEAWIVIATK